MSDLCFITEEEALETLGPKRVFTKKQVVYAWNSLVGEKGGKNSLSMAPNRKTNIRYHKATITEFSKKRMWRLVYDTGFSLFEMKEILGEDCSSTLRFCKENNWWRGNAYAFKKRKPGYLLIRVKRDFRNLSWERQEERIDLFLSRASVSLVLNTSISIFLVKNSFFDGLDHWGTELDNKETRCALGIRKKGCIFLYNRKIDCPSPFLGTCLIRKFDKSPA